MDSRYILDAVCSNEHCDKVLRNVRSMERVSSLMVPQFKLDPQTELFFSLDREQKWKSTWSLISILRVSHCSVENLLVMIRDGQTQDKRGKKRENVQKELETLISSFYKGLHDVWYCGPDDSKLVHYMKRFIQFSKSFTKDNVDVPLFLCLMAILKVMLEELTNVIQHGNNHCLQRHEDWLCKKQEFLEETIKSKVFKGVVISATTGGTFIVGANAALWILGFGAGGIVKGSIAAAWMSSIGIVAKGSFFASLQSFGAAGIPLLVSTSILGAGIVVGGASYVGYKLLTHNWQLSFDCYFENQKTTQKVGYFAQSTLEEVLLGCVPLDVDIPEDVQEICIFLYDPKKREKTSISRDHLKKKFAIRNSILVRKKNPNDNPSLFFKRKNNGSWEWISKSSL